MAQQRDSSGRFVKGRTDQSFVVEKEGNAQGPLETMKNPPDPDIEKPLVIINNPFKKILYWLNDIRKKQTTTFDFKIKIPLIALPIFLIVLGGAFQFFFNLGKAVEKKEEEVKPTPTAVLVTAEPTKVNTSIAVSKLGTIKATYQVQSLVNNVILSDSEESSQSATPTPIPPSNYVLVDKNDSITFLIIPSTISLASYVNQKVLVKGVYDSVENTLTVSKKKTSNSSPNNPKIQS